MNKTSWLLFFFLESAIARWAVGSQRALCEAFGKSHVIEQDLASGKWSAKHIQFPEKKRQLKFDIEEPFWFSFCLSFSCFLHVSVSAWMTKCDAFLKSAESRQKTADAGQFCKCKKTGDETGWAVTKKQCVKLNGLPSSVSMDVTVFWWCYLRGSNAERYLCGPNQKKVEASYVMRL